MKYFFPEPTEIAEKNRSGRICNTCGDRISDHKRKIFGNWICDLVRLDNGTWIHSRRVYEAVEAGHKVEERLIEDV